MHIPFMNIQTYPCDYTIHKIYNKLKSATYYWEFATVSSSCDGVSSVEARNPSKLAENEPR